MIHFIFLITLFLLIWFKSDAFIEYCKLFRLTTVFKIGDWETFKNTIDISTTYHTYLRLKYPNFFVKLITCPSCLCVWLTLPSCFIYGILYFPMICIMSLSMYYLINKLM